jgi:hypothetical protein
MRERKGASPSADTLKLARHATALSERYVAIIGDVSMRINDEEILSVAYDEDLETELADERYQRALKRITVDEVIARIDHVIASVSDARQHPLYHLVRHVLRHGGFRSSGRRVHVAEQLGAVYESLAEDAIEYLAQEELSHFGPWED